MRLCKISFRNRAWNKDQRKSDLQEVLPRKIQKLGGHEIESKEAKQRWDIKETLWGTLERVTLAKTYAEFGTM